MSIVSACTTSYSMWRCGNTVEVYVSACMLVTQCGDTGEDYVSACTISYSTQVGCVSLQCVYITMVVHVNLVQVQTTVVGC